MRGRVPVEGLPQSIEFVPACGGAAGSARACILLRGDGKEPRGGDLSFGEIAAREIEHVPPFAGALVIGHGVRERERFPELGDPFVEAELAFGELAREEAEDFARATRGHQCDIFGIDIAGIERRRVDEHQLARKFPRREHEHR